MIKKIVKIIAFLPWVWIFTFLLTCIYGYIQFGNIPKYGVDDDLASMGLDWVNIFALMVLIINYVVFFLLVILVVWGLFSKRYSFRDVKIYLILYFTGLVLFFYLRNFDIFLWFFD